MDRPVSIVLYDADTNEQIDELEEIAISLRIGDGLIGSRGERYRVVDRWESLDHHGRFSDHQEHVWVRDVAGTSEDRPGLTAPDYFTD